MMAIIHKRLTQERWFALSLVEQEEFWHNYFFQFNYAAAIRNGK